jgi:CNT family concentrative nucleoside transporter
MKSRTRIILVAAALLAVTWAAWPVQADGGPVPSADAGVGQAPQEATSPPVEEDAQKQVVASPESAAPESAVDDASNAPVVQAKSLAELKKREVDQSLGGRFMGLIGVVFMLALAFAVSVNRKAISWRLVAMGTGLQIAFAFLVLKTGVGKWIFSRANDAVTRLLSFSQDGARFVFGNLVDNNVPVGKPVAEPLTLTPVVGTEVWANVGSLIAFSVLPTIVFFSALTAILYHLNILQWVVRGMAAIMRKTMGTSGAETLSASANVFVGQTEAPLMVRPFLEKMTRSELMAVMTGGFATVAGGVLAAYVGILSGYFPDIAGHLLAASVMSAPASLVMAKIMVPETEKAETAETGEIHVPSNDANVLDAAARGTTEGLHLALNVGAMLIAFIALLALVNFGVGALGDVFGAQALTLERILGWILAPLAFLLGVPWGDAVVVGGLMGTKTVVNEFVAYLQLSSALGGNQIEHGRSVIIATYALCGFSNFSSIGIQIGGLATIAPGRRADLAQLGVRAMIAATLACFQTAAVAGMII